MPCLTVCKKNSNNNLITHFVHKMLHFQESAISLAENNILAHNVRTRILPDIGLKKMGRWELRASSVLALKTYILEKTWQKLMCHFWEDLWTARQTFGSDFRTLSCFAWLQLGQWRWLKWLKWTLTKPELSYALAELFNICLMVYIFKIGFDRTKKMISNSKTSP